MDFKGACWMGDIYQQFEAMCHDIQETFDEVRILYNIWGGRL